jgi:hypothetical protein
MKLGFAETYWYAEDEIKKILGEYLLNPDKNGKYGELQEPYVNGRKIRYKFDGRRKKPFGLFEKI